MVHPTAIEGRNNVSVCFLCGLLGLGYLGLIWFFYIIFGSRIL